MPADTAARVRFKSTGSIFEFVRGARSRTFNKCSLAPQIKLIDSQPCKNILRALRSIFLDWFF
jgi:hypothetical protein